MMGALESRIRLMVGRAVIAAVDDSMKAQGIQAELLDGEVHDGIEHYQAYGFSSVPLQGAEAVVAFVGGLRSHGIAIGTVDRRYRIRNLAGGEVAIHDDQGQKVHLTRDGIVIETDKPVTINGESLTVNAASDVTIEAAGTVTISSDDILLGAGAAAVARVGDDVDLGTGKIISGSAEVKA